MEDFQGFVQRAEAFVASQASGGEGLAFSLCKVTGTSADSPWTPMQRADEVQNWKFVYRLGEEPALRGRSLFVLYADGQFQEARKSCVPVMGSRAMDKTRVAVSLEEAIQKLNQAGFTSGFTEVSLFRPMHPAYPDEPTFVFYCQDGKTNVGISAQTGALLWKEVFGQIQ
jgi:hypothetical protein